MSTDEVARMAYQRIHRHASYDRMTDEQRQWWRLFVLEIADNLGD